MLLHKAISIILVITLTSFAAATTIPSTTRSSGLHHFAMASTLTLSTAIRRPISGTVAAYLRLAANLLSSLPATGSQTILTSGVSTDPTTLFNLDASHTGCTSNLINMTVSARSTTTSITRVPSPVNTGSPTICTVSVTDTDNLLQHPILNLRRCQLHPDTASAKTLSFRVLGTRTSNFNFNDDITNTSQSFDASIRNVANIDLVSRINVTITQPDGTTTSFVSDGLLLQSGQNGHITFIVPLTGPDGNYCFTATVKFGIDTNHNGPLDNNEVLGTSATQHDCFFADTDDVPAGTAIASPMTITNLTTDDDE